MGIGIGMTNSQSSVHVCLGGGEQNQTWGSKFSFYPFPPLFTIKSASFAPPEFASGGDTLLTLYDLKPGKLQFSQCYFVTRTTTERNTLYTFYFWFFTSNNFFPYIFSPLFPLDFELPAACRPRPPASARCSRSRHSGYLPAVVQKCGLEIQSD